MSWFKKISTAWNTVKNSSDEDLSMLGKFIKSLGNGLSSLWRGVTGTGLTTAQEQANAFSSNEAQKQRDWEEEMSNTSFQRQVADMQAAGVNPALMYGNGSSGASTPSGSSASSVSPSQGASMSDLMQLFLLPQQKELMSAQAENLRASAKKSGVQTEKIAEEIGLVRSKIENSNLDADQKRIALKYQDEFAQADLAIKAASADNLRANYDSLMESINKMQYDELESLGNYLESIERISVLEKSKELTDAQIAELGALTAKLNEERRHIKLTNDNFDLINGFVTNMSVDVGLKGASASGQTVLTLSDIRNGVNNSLKSAGKDVYNAVERFHP